MNSLVLLRIEVILTGMLMAMPIMVPFYHSIGMDQGEIGLSQAIFTVVLFFANVPTGWIADRFSRKFCNAIGDLGVAAGFLYYATATNFTEAVVAEITIGIFMAFSQGADNALLHAYSQSIDSSGKYFRKQTALLALWQPILQACALGIGAVIGAYDQRLAIAVSAVPFIIGSILSFFMKEAGERLVSQHRNPLRDMARVTRQSIGNDPYLRWLIIGFAVGREVTHVMIWALAPILLFAGVPLEVVGVAWVVNSMMVAFGARFAGKLSEPLKEWQRFLVPMIAVVAGLVVMSIHLSVGTVWLYALLGLAQGWTSATLLPLVQLRAPKSNQASIVSIAKSASQLLYVPLVWLVGLAGNMDIRLSIVVTLIVFVPMIAVVLQRLIVYGKK